MNKKIILVALMLSVSVILVGALVSAEKNWAFENYSVNVSHDLNVAGDATIDGNVGIGTSSPSDTLTVYRNDSGWTAVNFQNAHPTGIGMIVKGGSSSGGYIASFRDYANSVKVKIDGDGSLCLNGGADCRTTWPTGSGTGAFIDAGSLAYYNGGNVGIGTSSPGADLEVNGHDILLNDTTGYTRFTLDSNGADNLFRLRDGGVNKWLFGSDESSDHDFVISSGSSLSGNQKFVIDRGTGNVGIGTTTPTTKLDVNGSINISGTNAALFFSDGTNMTTAASGSGDSLWDNVSNVATYEGNVNITGNLSLSGEVTGQETSRVRVTKNDVQAIPSGTATIIEYDDVDFDILGEYDNTTNHRFTAKEAGYYSVSASLLSEVDVVWGAGEYWMLELWKNGALFRRGQHLRTAAVTAHRMSSIADTIYLEVDDYIDIRALHNQGGSVDTFTIVAYNHFSVQRLHAPITIGGGTGADGIWDNVSDVATYEGDVNITGNLSLGGEVTGQETSRVRVTKDDEQSIPNGVDTIVEYDDEDFDNLGEYDNTTNHRFTATEAGYYSVSASLLSATAAWTVGEFWQIRIYKNGVDYSRGHLYYADASVNLRRDSRVNDIIYLAANDYIDIRVHQTQGAAVNIAAYATYNFFSVARIHSPITIGGTGADGIWENISGAATYEGDVNITALDNDISMFTEGGVFVISG